MGAMEKEFINVGNECPVCHSSYSPLHSSECPGDHEIIEVAPPERGRRQLRCGQEEVEPSAFPLVSAAHEFKTPLVVMLGYTDLLLNGHLGAVNQRQKQVLGEIEEGAQRLQKLIQDLLLLQALKAGRIVAQNQESTSVDERVSEIFNYWAPTATQKRIRYQCNPSEAN